MWRYIILLVCECLMALTEDQPHVYRLSAKPQFRLPTREPRFWDQRECLESNSTNPNKETTIMQTFTPKQYLMLDVASAFGLDKKSWDERLAWFDAHKDHLLELQSKAEEPALYYAAVTAWHDVCAGQPTGYPVALDATASGMQILACLTGDRSAAALCNVIDTGRRQDAYTGIYEAMLSKIEGKTDISRADLKQAVMTALYGSKKVPKETFEKHGLLELFYETMGECAPAVWELNEAFLQMWNPNALSNDWVLPDNFHVHVKVVATVSEAVEYDESVFQIQRKVNAPMEKGRSLGANTIHSIDGMIVREMARRCNYDPDWVDLVRQLLDGESEHTFADPKMAREAARMTNVLWNHYQASGYLSARILDYLDADTIRLVEGDAIRELVDSLPAKPFKILTVHDCFRCLPTYGNDLRAQYNRQLHLIARSNMLSFLLTQIRGEDTPVSKLDDTLADDILAANYALS